MCLDSGTGQKLRLGVPRSTSEVATLGAAEATGDEGGGTYEGARVLDVLIVI